MPQPQRSVRKALWRRAGRPAPTFHNEASLAKKSSSSAECRSPMVTPANACCHTDHSALQTLWAQREGSIYSFVLSCLPGTQAVRTLPACGVVRSRVFVEHLLSHWHNSLLEGLPEFHAQRPQALQHRVEPRSHVREDSTFLDRAGDVDQVAETNGDVVHPLSVPHCPSCLNFVVELG